jgi:hypothetical protein
LGNGLYFNTKDFPSSFVAVIFSIVGSCDDVLPGSKNKEALESQEKSVKQTQAISKSKIDKNFTATNGYDPELGTITTVKKTAKYWGRRNDIDIDKANTLLVNTDVHVAKTKAENVELTDGKKRNGLR